jgi:tetratricopeptide (TPR) repeat protein
MQPRVVLLACLAALLVSACGASRHQAYLDEAKAAATDPQVEKEKQAAEAWEQRTDPEMLKKSLALYEEVATAAPGNRAVLVRLSRGYYLLATGYLKDEEAQLAAWDKGAGWGERVLGLNPEFRKRIAAGDDDYEALDTASREDAAGVYWAYANLGKWSVTKGFTTVLKNKSKLKAFIDRVAELDPKYYYGAGDRGLGAFYAKAPSFAGGDTDKAREHFERSLKIEPSYFGTKTLMAQYLAVKTQDRELFEKVLKEVIAGDINVIPEIMPMQKIEQERAKELLGQAEDLFE